MYEVVCGKIGLVYKGDDEAKALNVFAAHVNESNSVRGRIAGENVYLHRGDDVAKVHRGHAYSH